MTSPSDAFDLRVAMQEGDYDPIPLIGKKAKLTGWQNKRNVSREEMAGWSVDYPEWSNTGGRTERMPTWDNDIRYPEAAEAVHELIRDWFDGRGTILTRFGEAPRFAIPFRTEQPFKKIRVDFKAPDGSDHHIEILGDGQQIVVDGIHPDTKKPYAWHADRSPENVPRSELPETNEAEMQSLVKLASELLQEKFEFEQVQAGSSNGHGDTAAGGHSEPVDVEAELAAMNDGKSTNDAQCRIIPSLLWKMHPDEVLDYVVDATMAMADRLGLGWKRDDEVYAVRKRILSVYNNLFLKDYDPATGVIPAWLPGEFHEAWTDRLQEGRRPVISFNSSGFYVRSKQGTGTDSDDGNGDDSSGAQAQSEPKPEKPFNGRRVLELRPFVPIDVAMLPPRSWLYGRHYQRRTVSLTAGPGGMGKSSLDMVEAIAMATARNLLGEQPEERLRIWYHNGEDPRDEIDRRLVAICQHYGIPQEELQGYLWTTSGTEFPLRVAKGYANMEIDAVLVRQISAAISDNQIDLAVFDPLVTLHSVSEVDSGKMDTVVRLFAGIADENDAAIEIAHHVRKPLAGSAADYDVHDIRGVAAITDAVRAARVLNRMNEKDADAAGCAEAERLSRFRVDRAKGNYSRAEVATWRQFISVALINGDDVGVVAPWDFPGQGEQTPEKAAADQKAEYVFMQLLDKFTARGANVSANSGPTYAPARFDDEREAKTAKVSKAALKAAMNRLLDAGRIRSEPSGRGEGRSHRLVPAQGASQ